MSPADRLPETAATRASIFIRLKTSDAEPRELAWRQFSLGLSATNLLNTQYRQVELNYASNFQTSGALPSLVPARHFAAGAPRTVLVTLAVHLGGDQ